jgi:hypothetical protein
MGKLEQRQQLNSEGRQQTAVKAERSSSGSEELPHTPSCCNS